MRYIALTVLLLVSCCGLYAPTDESICTNMCLDHNGLERFIDSDDHVQLLCYCNDGSVQIHVREQP